MHITLEAMMREGLDRETAIKFFKYHNERPEIFTAFEKKTLARIANNERVSGKLIVEQLRDEDPIPDHTGPKVSNTWTSAYVRAFVIKYPEHRHLFQLNELMGVKSAA